MPLSTTAPDSITTTKSAIAIVLSRWAITILVQASAASSHMTHEYDDLVPSDCVALQPHVRILRAPNLSGQDCFFVYTGLEEIELPVASNAWFDRVICSKEFIAMDACSWTEPAWSWSEAKRILDELVADGIVSVLPPR